MDAVTTITTALGAAIASGGQAALSDTAKEAFEYLKKRLLGIFSGRQNALMVLQGYEDDPDTWEKPLKALLAKTNLAQDEVTINKAQELIHLLGQQANTRGHTNILHTEVANGPVCGTNNGTINFTTGENKKKSAETALARGRDALWRGEYRSAKQCLEKVTHLLVEDQSPTEEAQIKYLQALALLSGKRPFSTAYQIMRIIEELLQGAIVLHPSKSYLCALALIKQDYSRNGFAHLATEAQRLFHQMQLTPPSSQDQENMELLLHSQPALLSSIEKWW